MNKLLKNDSTFGVLEWYNCTDKLSIAKQLQQKINNLIN